MGLAGALVLKVVITVGLNIPGYFEPDFATDFLRGREAHFAGLYRWAFGVHILAGPLTLVLGWFLVGAGWRSRLPRGHRIMGRVQVGCILLLVTPSGLVMARHAAAGRVAGAGLAALAIATAGSAVLGVRAARGGRLADHRSWMIRCSLLLGSAVVLRVMGGAATVLGVTADWYDPLATWDCWISPLVTFEIIERCRAGHRAGRADSRPDAGAGRTRSIR